MNPYLERTAVWNDFYDGYVHKLRAALAPQVLPRYFVRVGEHVYLRELPEARVVLTAHPDVSVSTRPLPAGGGPAVIAEAPATIELIDQLIEERPSYLEVIDRSGGQVVTVVEVLSPANKYAGPDREKYLSKRRQLTHGRVNYVEIDLLRGGPRTVPNLPACDYNAVVIRAPYWDRAGVWPIRLRDPLPTIPIPLQPGEPDARLDLQPPLHALYDEAGYQHFVYLGDPEPQLSTEDAAWAAGLVPRPI